ncbi:Anaerobic ribonucleoside-triphosphate reductase [Sporobacter termitidis DSM 10068]|uniref:Anaerobic ribonucleoside-triphosphate reductase n=1 Tax=Sporobacter termitidis DSM 10068 TaxID=1123282 RepID=A0A1M5Y6F6_9FIRM|nr:anaerobic ribonucleoside-triphosphate reductase [Sporobacter termitidis]SHI07665.1 Anaerobic ribonucleoside-triphosphate reductase [Sporobacter termitidis DSM 10068]
MDVRVVGGELSPAEVEAYVSRAREKYPDKIISGVDIAVDGEFVDMTYHWKTVPFERIRRITGYLVGTLERFNDGKRAEESDRVKHACKQ